MTTPQEDVFDNLLLRHLILSCLIKLEYNEQLRMDIKELVGHLIIHKWHKYCRCDECITYTIEKYNIMDN